jgi:hypothetical protein
MSINHQTLAERVVKVFAENLDPPLRAQISKAQLEDLELLVHEALAEAVNSALERLEEVVKQLRSETGKLEIEL